MSEEKYKYIKETIADGALSWEYQLKGFPVGRQSFEEDVSDWSDMGCDIHLHIEVKIKGVWHHYSVCNVDRNYYIFAKMAGVRGDMEGAISPPKGLPADVTELTRLDRERYGVDGHNDSWLSVEQVKELIGYAETLRGPYGAHLWDTEQFGYLFGNGWDWWPRNESANDPEGLEDFRFVFWFDN